MRIYTGRRVLHGVKEAVIEVCSMTLGLAYAVETELDTVRAYHGERPRALRMCPCREVRS